VLTETVWSLSCESPPVIPDQIVVLTTATGARQLAAQLFGPDAVWSQLRRSILGPAAESDHRLDFDTTPDRLKVVHHRVGARRAPLDELSGPEQNTAFADAIVQELWGHTSQPDVCVVASLAGGFKTMSALMLSAMQLLANPGDRVTHVLVSGGYESTTPPFYFPQQENQTLRTREGAILRASAACLRLIDLPVIPLRRWFEQSLNRQPPSYEVLVRGSLDALEQATGDVLLDLGPVVLGQGESKHWIRVNGVEYRLSPDRYAYLRFFSERLGEAPFPGAVHAEEALKAWVSAAAGREPRLARMSESVDDWRPADGVLPKRLKDLRTFLERLPGGRALAAALPAKGHWGLRLPPARVTLA
jgi:CRISPR-associated protein (TIGR02584 family)